MLGIPIIHVNFIWAEGIGRSRVKSTFLGCLEPETFHTNPVPSYDLRIRTQKCKEGPHHGIFTSMSLKLWWLQQLFCYQTLEFTNVNWGLQGWRKESLSLQTNYLKLLSIPVSEHHSPEGRVHLSVTQLGIKFMSLSWWWEQVKREGAEQQEEEWGKEGHRITRWHKRLEIRAAWASLLDKKHYWLIWALKH